MTKNAGVVGLEPTVPVLETGGLPLTDTPGYGLDLKFDLLMNGVTAKLRAELLYFDLGAIALLLAPFIIVMQILALTTFESDNISSG